MWGPRAELILWGHTDTLGSIDDRPIEINNFRPAGSRRHMAAHDHAMNPSPSPSRPHLATCVVTMPMHACKTRWPPPPRSAGPARAVPRKIRAISGPVFYDLSPHGCANKCTQFHHHPIINHSCMESWPWLAVHCNRL